MKFLQESGRITRNPSKSTLAAKKRAGAGKPQLNSNIDRLSPRLEETGEEKGAAGQQILSLNDQLQVCGSNFVLTLH